MLKMLKMLNFVTSTSASRPQPSCQVQVQIQWAIGARQRAQATLRARISKTKMPGVKKDAQGL